MTSDPEAAIRRVFDNWFAGTSSRDIDRVMQGIAHDIVSYEHDVPLQYTGIDAVRSVCQRGLDMSGPGTEWCVPETTILVRDDIAVQWGLNRMRFSAENGSPGESWSRGTRVFHKGTDGWEMVHQHVSYPYEPQTGQARTDLSPGTPAKVDDGSGSPSGDSAEGEVRQTIERWVKAVQARDLEAVTVNHTADVSMFDVPPPVVHRGLEAYRGTWPASRFPSKRRPRRVAGGRLVRRALTGCVVRAEKRHCPAAAVSGSGRASRLVAGQVYLRAPCRHLLPRAKTVDDHAALLPWHEAGTRSVGSHRRNEDGVH